VDRPDPSEGSFKNNFDWALEETEKVEVRLVEVLKPRIFAVPLLLGLVPNATRRISTEIAAPTAQDTCAVFHASRVFTDAMGTFILLRKGLWVQTTSLTRNMLESVAQAIALMCNPEMAEAWLEGRRFSPGQVRKRLSGKPDFGPLYSALSAIAHANPEGRWAHSVPVVGTLGVAISYGGTYQPKTAARSLAVLVDLILIYLQEFYGYYSNRLSISNWPIVIELGRSMNEELRRWAESLPEDWEELQPHLPRLVPAPMPPSVLDQETVDRMLASMLEHRNNCSRGSCSGEDGSAA